MTLTASEPSADAYEISEEALADCFRDVLYQQLIQSSAFQRLKDIRFLGAIDYLVRPNGQLTSRRHTRFQHSLGVARLAQMFARSRSFPLHAERLMVCSALLHDVGHAPLSHSMERIFNRLYGLNHHLVTESIISGRVPLGHDIPKILREARINVQDVIDTIDGRNDDDFDGLFGGPINVDTIEGISRSYSYISADRTVPTKEFLIGAVSKLQVAREEAIQAIDGFWSIKGSVYAHLIQNSWSLKADFVATRYVEQNKPMFSRHSYFQSETVLLQQHPKLKTMLQAIATPVLHGVTVRIDYQKRVFTIDRSVEIASFKDFPKRYLQSKHPSVAEFVVGSEVSDLFAH